MDNVIQTLRTLKSNQGYFSVIEYVTPYKICVAIFLHEYVSLRWFKYRDPVDPDESGLEVDEAFCCSVTLNSIERKDGCRLLLKLLQHVDVPLSELAPMILQNPDYQINPSLKACWKRKMDEVCSDTVSGLMCLMTSLEKLSADGHTVPMLNR